MKKLKPIFSRISNFVNRYGVAAALKKTFQKLFSVRRPVNRIRSTKKDVGYIPDDFMELNNELYQKFPGMRPLTIMTMPKRTRTINLVIEDISAENQSGIASAPLIFAALLSNKYDFSLRIITRRERPQKKCFAQALLNAKVNYDKEVEFIYYDPSANIDVILISEDDFFITTSWWITRSVMDSFAEEKIIYFVQHDERKTNLSEDEFEMCSKVLNDAKINYMISSKELFDFFVSDGFENLKNNAQWFELSSENWMDSFTKLYSWLEKRDSIKCIK